MRQHQMAIRYIKIALIAAVALFVTLVAFNNLTDYDSNFQFVKHVLEMDTTFPGNRGMWRAIESNAVHHGAYMLIIATQIAMAVLSWWGCWKLFSARGDTDGFNRAKTIPAVALAIGILLWFGGFMGVGAEWFLMWQSEVWNGIQAAFRFVAVLLLILIFLMQEDK